jgi:hypothetical protein
MSKGAICEDVKPLTLSFSDLHNLVVVPTIGDGNCYFHSVLRAFNTTYINAKTVFERINLARTFRNGLADRLSEIDPITGEEYYSGLNNGALEQFADGVKEYTKEALRTELLSSQPVDNIYQELISNFINKDIYMINSETNDMIFTGTAFSLYYKGRNSIIIYYTPGHYEVVGIQRSSGDINTVFTPEHPLIQVCRERLINAIRQDKKKKDNKGLSPRVTTMRGSSPHRNI